MMRTYVPEDIVDGVKQGFSAPDASWFKGDSIDYVRKQLMCAGARIYSILDRATTQALISEHLDGRENRRLLIWSLLNVEAWSHAYDTI
jgi:asparagine synthase (glutamine-hydrolysing)